MILVIMIMIQASSVGKQFYGVGVKRAPSEKIQVVETRIVQEKARNTSFPN